MARLIKSFIIVMTALAVQCSNDLNTLLQHNKDDLAMLSLAGPAPCDPSNADLSNLTLSSGALSPGFASGTTSYSATLSVPSITVTPTAASSCSTIEVNGTPVTSGSPSGSISTPVGVTNITIVVTAGDLITTNTYTVAVTSCYSSDADLSNITLSSGALTPAFASGTTSYTTSVNVASITVTPTAADSCSTILVNGTAVASGNPSGSINTPAGTTNITVQVTAGDAVTTKTYTIAVNSTYSTDAGLSNLTLSSGALTPSFATGTYSYTSTVNVAAITVTPTASDLYASITVNGTPVASGSPSGSINTPLGLTTITVVVTAGDLITTNTYTVDVTSCYSTDADLSNLTISAGALTPAFASGTINYTDSVSVSQVTVTPTAANACSTITVNGTSVASGSASGSITIYYGSNTITVIVTAGDGLTTKTYTIGVSRSNILPADFTSNKPITLDTTSGGATVAGDVNDFPVLIRITDSAIIDSVNSGAPDLRFLYKDGTTWLDYEIERWDQTNDLAEVWVLVPTVLGNTSEVALTMYYDEVAGVTIPDGQCATCVFDTANNFYGAWHLNEDPSGGTVYDRTDNSYDGTPASMDAGNLVDGLIGKGLSFDGSAEYIDIATTQTDRNNITNSSNYTISTWMKTNITDEAWHSLVDFSGATGNAFVGLGYGQSYGGGPYGGAWWHYAHSWHSDDANDTVRARDPIEGIDDQTWHHMAVTRNGTSFTLFIDGSAADMQTSAIIDVTTATLLQFGRNPYGSGMQYFNGILDEVRIFNTNVSADWIRLCHENQKASQTLVSY